MDTTIPIRRVMTVYDEALAKRLRKLSSLGPMQHYTQELKWWAPLLLLLAGCLFISRTAIQRRIVSCCK